MRDKTWLGRVAALMLLLLCTATTAAQCPTCPPTGQPAPVPPALVSPAGETAVGWFVQIPDECHVRNVGGNCGFCAIETISRYQGLQHMHGFSRGKGGCTSYSMASWLNKYRVNYEQATSRAQSIDLMKRYLSQGQPVLFSIPGHALVCCGWTKAPDGREFVWVADNTGSEGCRIKGWPKSEWDRRFDGWVCGIRDIFPIFDRPNRPQQPRQPHVDPVPGLVPAPAPSVVDKLAEFEKRLAALAEVEKRLAVLEKNLDAGSVAIKDTSSRLERLHEVAEKAAALAAGVSTRFSDELPKLHAAVTQAKDLGLVSSEKADKAHAALDKVGAVAGVISELREKQTASQAEVRQTGLLGWLGGGAGLAGSVLGLIALLRKNDGTKILPSQIPQLPGNPILNTAANLPQIPGTIADDIVRVIAQRVQSAFAPPPATPPAAA